MLRKFLQRHYVRFWANEIQNLGLNSISKDVFRCFGSFRRFLKTQCKAYGWMDGWMDEPEEDEDEDEDEEEEAAKWGKEENE